MNRKIGESLTLIIDLNSNFIIPLAESINILLSAIKTTFGLHLIHNTYNLL